MIKSKDDYYKNVDRSVLTELRRIYKKLEKKLHTVGSLTDVERNAYMNLQELFSDAIYRPFFQGNDNYTALNEMDYELFKNTLSTTLKYISVCMGAIEKDLYNRLCVIYDMTKEKSNEGNQGEFANGSPVNVRDLSEEQFKRAAAEFSEGSTALQDFLCDSYERKLFTHSCCSGHECVNGTASKAFILYIFDDEIEMKKYLLSKAFEMGMYVAIIDFNDGIGFNIIPSPHGREEQINYLNRCMKKYKGKEKIDPVVDSMLAYMENIGHKKGRYSAIEFFKVGVKAVGIKERTPLNSRMSGVFPVENVIDAYRQNDSTKLVPLSVPPKVAGIVTGRDVAQLVLEMTKTLPGRFSESMRQSLLTFRKCIGFEDKSR